MPNHSPGAAGQPEAFVGLTELSRMSSVSRETLSTYVANGILPPPEIEVGRRPAWRRKTVQRWAREVKAAAGESPTAKGKSARGAAKHCFGWRPGQAAQVQA